MPDLALITFKNSWEAGHEVPFYQPLASLAMFNRTINNLVIADGSAALTPDYDTSGQATVTHTESFVPLPTTSSTQGAASSTQSAAAVSSTVSTSDAKRRRGLGPEIWW